MNSSVAQFAAQSIVRAVAQVAGAPNNIGALKNHELSGPLVVPSTSRHGTGCDT